MRTWSKKEIAFLRTCYPEIGRAATAKKLGRTVNEVRAKTSRLGLKLDHGSRFCKEWQTRAASSKVGKKRPAQAEVIRRLHAAGKLRKTPEQRKAIGERVRKWLATNGHPRGFLGKKHSAKTRRKIGDANRRRK